MPEKSIFEQISNPQEYYTDGYGVQRPIHEKWYINPLRKFYNAADKFLNGSDITLPDGTIKEEEKRCDEIHFIVTYEVSVAGKVKVEKKTMPTLPMITGGGRNRSSWTIENILTHGNIIGMIDTTLIE